MYRISMSFEGEKQGTPTHEQQTRETREKRVQDVLRELGNTERKQQVLYRQLAEFPGVRQLLEQVKEVANVAKIAIVDNIPVFGELRVLVLNVLLEFVHTKWNTQPYTPQTVADIKKAMHVCRELRQTIMAGDASLLEQLHTLDQDHARLSAELQQLLSDLDQDSQQ